MTGPEPILICWSGGKDSAMALFTLCQRPHVRVVALLTTITEGYERISMHDVRRELLVQQTESVGLPLQEARISPQCVKPIYEARMAEALSVYFYRGVRNVAFGDIFLEDLRAYREKNPHTASGLLSCYAAGVPLSWNTLAGDAFYAVLFFGGFAPAERLFSAFCQPSRDVAS